MQLADVDRAGQAVLLGGGDGGGAGRPEDKANTTVAEPPRRLPLTLRRKEPNVWRSPEHAATAADAVATLFTNVDMYFTVFHVRKSFPFLNINKQI